jgi:cytochrome o ubiquinol oxidase subunit 3
MSTAVKAHTESEESKTYFGFWVYLMTDLILFASLFATFAVLRNKKNGGLSGAELISLPYVLVETLLLLASSFTSGLALLAIHRNNKRVALILFGITFAFGAAFLGMELVEFSHLVRDGNSWRSSGFLSAYFTLVGTHGLHIFVGLTWLGVITGQLIWRGITPVVTRRTALFSLFWHFLDIVWIFIFSIVYLMGIAQG